MDIIDKLKSTESNKHLLQQEWCPDNQRSKNMQFLEILFVIKEHSFDISLFSVLMLEWNVWIFDWISRDTFVTKCLN